MKAVVVLLVLCVAFALAQPPRPVVSETYEAKINLEFQNNSFHAYGIGMLRGVRRGKEGNG